MKTIGITGGIGSGKSVVSRILRLRGCLVYDCDAEAKRIMDESAEVLAALNGRFGEEVCPKGGPIDRKRLAQFVFGSDEERLWLNSLVHRLVREDIMRWRQMAAYTGKEKCFVESAIMASSGLSALCNEIWIVTASEDVRISRVGFRDGIDIDSIRRRIKSQEDEEKLLWDSGVPIRLISNNPEDSLLFEILPES